MVHAMFAYVGSSSGDRSNIFQRDLHCFQPVLLLQLYTAVSTCHCNLCKLYEAHNSYES